MMALKRAVCWLLVVVVCPATSSLLGVACDNCTVCPNRDCSVNMVTDRECSDSSLPLECSISKKNCFQDAELINNICNDRNRLCPEDTPSWTADIRHTFKYRADNTLYLELEWVSDQSIGPYTLMVAYPNNGDICQFRRVATHLSQNQSSFRTVIDYHEANSVRAKIYVWLIPDMEKCNGPAITIRVPQNCYSLCPGRCSCMMQSLSHDISIKNNSHLCVNDTTSAVSISWEPAEPYHVPNPSMTFTLTLSTGEAVVAVFAVVGKTDAVLYIHKNIAVSKIKITEMTGCVDPHVFPSSGDEEVVYPCLPNPSNSTAASALSTVTSSNSMLVRPSAASSNAVPVSMAPSTISTSVASLSLQSTHPTMSRTSGATFTPVPAGGTKSSMSALYITSAILVLVVVVMATILAILIVRRSRRKMSSETSNEKICKELKVLVLFSPASSQYDWKCITENVIKELARYGIHSVFFQNTSQRGSITEWLDSNIKNCSKVFMVCNKQFAQEWFQPTGDYLRGNSVVYLLRQVVDSFVIEDKRKLEKFAILYLTRRDQNCLNYPFIRNIKSFLVNPRDKTHMEQVVHFIHDQKTYVLP